VKFNALIKLFKL